LTRLGLADPVREARLLTRIIETISAGLDLDEIMQGVAALVTETTDTDVCFVHLLDDDGRRLVLRGATPPFQRLAGQVELKIGEGVSGWVAAHCRPAVIVSDKQADRRYKYIPELRGEEFTSMVSVPILSKPQHLVGVLNVHTRKRREFTDADVELLRSVAGLMAGAIENARLHRRLAEREEALERFAERIVLAQETERRRLAGEIHDGISQRVVSLSFHLSAAADAVAAANTAAANTAAGDAAAGDAAGADAAGGDGTAVDAAAARAEADGTEAGGIAAREIAAREIATAQSLAEAALDETRFAIAGLHPPVLDDLGLAASLESLARSFPHLAVRADVQACRLPAHVETAVYRITQEALQNVAKHAEARLAEVRLSAHSDTIVLEVEDDGKGFAPAVLIGQAAGIGYGVAGMRERAELIGGRLELQSCPGQGTVLRLTFPAAVSQ
jgi:two-component system, NarL family, sensor kinase